MKKDPSLQLSASPLSPDEVTGMKVAIIGGTGGIGRALARELASLGACVSVVGQTFRDAGTANIEFIPADLSLMQEARRVADTLPAETLDVVVFTTGIFASPKRQETPEGLERDMAVSFLSRQVILQGIASRLGVQLPKGHRKPRVFIMGYPGTGQAGILGDLNSERSYSAMAAHMNTVAGNEMLVLDSALRYPNINVYGLNPGLIKTDIRSNFLGGNKFLFALLEGLIGVFTPTAEAYARRMVPHLLNSQLNGVSGALLNSKGQAILPSTGLTPAHIRTFLTESRALIERAVDQQVA